MEICRLHDMLTEAGIEHEFRDRTPPGWGEFVKEYGRLYPDEIDLDRNWGWQVIVYRRDGTRLISAIEGFGSIGFGSWFDGGTDYDLIEIMGLLTPEEGGPDDVVGYLTAEEVFQRIKEAIDG